MDRRHKNRSSDATPSEAYVPRVAPFPRAPLPAYGVPMSNGDEVADTEWARYLKEVTSRDCWSVARLAREAGLDRGTIFRWMRGSADKITVESVRRVATATGDTLDTALRAAGGVPADPDLSDDDEFQFEIEMVQRSDLPDAQKTELIRYIKDLQRRQRDDLREMVARQRADRRTTISRVMDITRGGPQTVH